MPRPNTMNHPLPPGQREIPLRQFGLPETAGWRPGPESRAEIEIRGEISPPQTVNVTELIEVLGRRDLRSDLHCVATWSATDLRWSGLGFADFWTWLGGQAELGDVGWLFLQGADGWSACLSLEDALAPEVLLADRLNDVPIPAEHGAPLRLIAPAHYGYKNVKNLAGITLLSAYRAGASGWAEHPRARVAREERSPGLPGQAFRMIYAALRPLVFARYDRKRRTQSAT
jgi:DMSO/TMAO reductase YedYZ molybdopterin-dependent catalytic subunit